MTKTGGRPKSNAALLGSVLDLDQSPAEAAQLLLIMEKSVPKSRSEPLLTQVKGASWDWITSDELLDVCMRLLALSIHDSDSIDGVAVASLAKKMIANEKQPGGPYQDSKGVLDVATNAAIAQLFASFGAPLPLVNAFLEECLSRRKLESEHISLWLTLLLLGWPNSIFDKKRLWSILRAIKQDDAVTSSGDKKVFSFIVAALKPENTMIEIDNDIVVRAHSDLKMFDEPLRRYALSLWESVRTADKYQEISMLPTFFADTLMQRPHSITDEICFDLGLANFYMWMAYTIYDDFIDDEGEPSQLSVANIVLRKSIRLYGRMLEAQAISPDMIQAHFDKMDMANAWELAECRFAVAAGRITIGTLPRYGNRTVLAQRAIGHMLGPLAISLLLEDSSSRQNRSLYDGCLHYLIARQLNDDLCDWRSDLEAGHISFVVTFLLRKMKIKTGSYELSELISRLESYFWQIGVLDICKIALQHVERARDNFEKSELLQTNGSFFDPLDDIEKSLIKSRTIPTEQREFLRTYTS